MRWKAFRVSASAPDQTDTDKSMMFMAANPATAVARYRAALLSGDLRSKNGEALIDQLPALRGQDLGCWCDLDKPCHADVLLELANASSFADRDPRPPG